MPMREECKHFESRTYANGETVRKCNLDLAPEAPWRCPDQCVGYERRLADVDWSHGTLVTPETPTSRLGLDDGLGGRLLDEAEDIINAAGPEILAEVEAERPQKGWRFRAADADSRRLGRRCDLHPREFRRVPSRRRRRPLPGPAWLSERARRAERAAAALADAEEEIWRYSRIDELDLDDVRAGDGLRDRGHGGEGLVGRRGRCRGDRSAR